MKSACCGAALAILWLAYEEMGGYQVGRYDRYDWASPGKNWPANP